MSKNNIEGYTVEKWSLFFPFPQVPHSELALRKPSRLFSMNSLSGEKLFESEDIIIFHLPFYGLALFIWQQTEYFSTLYKEIYYILSDTWIIFNI